MLPKPHRTDTPTTVHVCARPELRTGPHAPAAALRGCAPASPGRALPQRSCARLWGGVADRWGGQRKDKAAEARVEGRGVSD